jgi:DNA-binding protein HU-beta
VNKRDIVRRIAVESKISRARASAVVDTTVDTITTALRKGDRVALGGLGTFSVSRRKPRNGRNQQAVGTITPSARRVTKFTPSPNLKKAVNQKVSPPDSFVSAIEELSEFY